MKAIYADDKKLYGLSDKIYDELLLLHSIKDSKLFKALESNAENVDGMYELIELDESKLIKLPVSNLGCVSIFNLEYPIDFDDIYKIGYQGYFTHDLTLDNGKEIELFFDIDVDIEDDEIINKADENHCYIRIAESTL